MAGETPSTQPTPQAPTQEPTGGRLRELRDQNSWWTTAVFGIASVALLNLAVRQTSALCFIALILFGAMPGAVAMSAVASWASKPDHERGRLFAFFILAGATLATVGLSGWVGWLAPFAATFGLAAMAIAVVIATKTWQEQARARPDLSVPGGIFTMIVGVALATGRSWSLLLGVVISIIGLTSTKGGTAVLLTGADDPARPGKRLAGWCALLTAVGGGLAIGSGGSLVAPGVVIAFIGASLLALGVTFWMYPPGSHKARANAPEVAGVAGILIAGISAAALAGQFSSWPSLVLIVVALVLTIGMFLVFKGEAVIAIVLIGALVGWVMQDRVDEWGSPTDEVPLLVTFGDSFAAGEGARTFLPGTNTNSETGNSCRRSTQSASALVALHYGMDWRSYACSGASIPHLAEQGQVDGAELRKGTWQAKEDETLDEVAGQFPQLVSADSTEYELEGDPDLIIFGFGGNDSSFSKVVGACLVSEDCTDGFTSLRDEAKAIEGPLVKALNSLTERYVAPVIVMQYPHYVGPGECANDFGISTREMAFANLFIGYLNTSIASAVAEARDSSRIHLVTWADHLGPAFAGRTMCDDKPAANRLHFLPRSGSVVERLNPATWIHGTAHPNPTGHACLASAIVALIESGQALMPNLAATGDNPDCPLLEVDYSDGVDAATAYLEEFERVPPLSDTTEEWLTGKVRGQAGPVAALVVAILVGGALLALGLLPLLRPIRMTQAFVPTWMLDTPAVGTVTDGE